MAKKKSDMRSDLNELLSTLIMMIVFSWFVYNYFCTDKIDQMGNDLVNFLGITEEVNSLEDYLRERGIMNT